MFANRHPTFFLEPGLDQCVRRANKSRKVSPHLKDTILELCAREFESMQLLFAFENSTYSYDRAKLGEPLIDFAVQKKSLQKFRKRLINTTRLAFYVSLAAVVAQAHEVLYGLLFAAAAGTTVFWRRIRDDGRKIAELDRQYTALYNRHEWLFKRAKEEVAPAAMSEVAARLQRSELRTEFWPSKLLEFAPGRA
ncbi:MAG: hypothetical protein HY053_06150 [Proteobacteria bacterium]|nr:hypothetical protein [Pseudomonadota bacterium]